MDKLPLLDLDFRTTYVEGNVLYTPSKGSLVSRAVMGTGVPGSGTIPGITPVGASFNGSQYANLTTADLISYNAPFSLVVRARWRLSAANDQHIVSNYNGSTPLALVRITTLGALYVWLNDSGGHAITATSTALPAMAPMTAVVTYDGTCIGAGLNIYLNGIASVASTGGSALTSTVSSGSAYNIGRHPTGADFLKVGTTMRRLQVFPFALSPAQVRAIHNKFEREGEA